LSEAEEIMRWDECLSEEIFETLLEAGRQYAEVMMRLSKDRTVQ
jgi:hypothetical protein